MKLHKEGHKIVLLATLGTLFLMLIARMLITEAGWTLYLFYLLFLLVWVGVIYFFRSPLRHISRDEFGVISPADGTIVVVEQTNEKEYFCQPMKQVSIFMSPLNVHVNRCPSDAKVVDFRYHPGKFLVAWHPKSSVFNERTSIVFETPSGFTYMVRQIAGAVARRIICYCREVGQEVDQGEELGFIKFGSRVDLFLPLAAKIHVKPGDKVRGGITNLASFPALAQDR